MLIIFELLKPWWVQRLKTWKTCCCRCHQELKELQGFNDMRISGRGIHDNCLCSYIEICVATTYDSHSNIHYATQLWTFNGLIALWTSILCEKELDAMWHHSQCIAGECACCGWKSLRLCPWELNTDNFIKWCSIGYEVVGHIEEGK